MYQWHGNRTSVHNMIHASTTKSSTEDAIPSIPTPSQTTTSTPKKKHTHTHIKEAWKSFGT